LYRFVKNFISDAIDACATRSCVSVVSIFELLTSRTAVRPSFAVNLLVNIPQVTAAIASVMINGEYVRITSFIVAFWGSDISF
jgi:hypothetical protein